MPLMQPRATCGARGASHGSPHWNTSKRQASRGLGNLQKRQLRPCRAAGSIHRLEEPVDGGRDASRFRRSFARGSPWLLDGGHDGRRGSPVAALRITASSPPPNLGEFLVGPCGGEHGDDQELEAPSTAVFDSVRTEYARTFLFQVPTRETRARNSSGSAATRTRTASRLACSKLRAGPSAPRRPASSSSSCARSRSSRKCSARPRRRSRR